MSLTKQLIDVVAMDEEHGELLVFPGPYVPVLLNRDLLEATNTQDKCEEWMDAHDIDPLWRHPLKEFIDAGLLPHASCEGHDIDDSDVEAIPFNIYIAFRETKSPNERRLLRFLKRHLWRFLEHPHGLTFEHSVLELGLSENDVSSTVKKWTRDVSIRYSAYDELNQCVFFRALGKLLELYRTYGDTDLFTHGSANILEVTDEKLILSDNIAIPLKTPMFYHILMNGLLELDIKEFTTTSKQINKALINSGLFHKTTKYRIYEECIPLDRMISKSQY